MIYEKIIRPVFFKTDPEKIHHFVIGCLAVASNITPVSYLIRKFLNVSDPILQTQVGQVKMPNPVGLAAGFDKDIVAPLAYSMLGFGHAELGSVTYKAQPGNPKPRLWRLPKDKGLIVYYGLSNDGAVSASNKMKRLKKHSIPLGVSIAPTTGLTLEGMLEDYEKSFEELFSVTDFITVNVSCPNVVGCDLFTQVSFTKDLLEKINKLRKKLNTNIDVFLKIGPDMTDAQFDEIVEVCVANGVSAIVATNLIKDLSKVTPNSSKEELNHPGGISGKLVQDKSNEVIKYLYKRAAGRLQIIGVGGVFTARDAYDKIKAGASAVQLITGFIYGGPTTMMSINKGLVELLKKDGLKNISEAVGKSV